MEDIKKDTKVWTITKLGEAKHKNPLKCICFQNDDEYVLYHNRVTITNNKVIDMNVPNIYLEMAGPKEYLFFDPEKTKVGIVTCGGLAPGLNNVIRGLTLTLWYRYGVRNIVGFKYGYQGCIKGSKVVELTPDTVKEIHKIGGTILGTSRGEQNIESMVDFLSENKVDIFFGIGGDGTFRGLQAISKEARKRKLSMSVVGIPKTIDGDIPYTDETFGFETAVELAQLAIDSGHNEAKSAENGVSIIRLFGRYSGFISLYSTLANGDVNLVLLPEVPFTSEKVLKWLENRLDESGHAVIVVAEGAGQNLFEEETCRDQSGNLKNKEIGLFLKKVIEEHFKKSKKVVNIKYIDPSYTIRSAPCNTVDSVFCLRLSQMAVHSVMSGRTDFAICKRSEKFVMVPLEEMVKTTKKMKMCDPVYQSVIDATGIDFLIEDF